MIKRCKWAGSDPLMIKYHDEEWGIPVHDDRKLFEMLILEGAQAGLSWKTVLHKRESYKKAFDNFEVEKVANYSNDKVEELISNAGIIRNKLKILSTIQNAKMFLKIQQEFGSFDKYIWQFTDYKTINNDILSIAEIPTKTSESDKMSKDLLKRGFKFVGSTICYAFMQATGMVNDHEIGCFCKKKQY
jgi:DNA-3-methyladenine glycosylase I